ncbi:MULTISPECIES: serine hydrolase [Pseudoxanthomonas]|uniref:CubicO group peptidase (Beta-lactamase class C family) n=1 Tax=Pseudoxanthomonas taiwanensis J19 TaxID=935569 RepID=A0A562E3H3_9GAMM|nr:MULTISPECIES: serine hydrolase [Pseudoxanthomonas]TWH16585.1 CubicO group peptidase (beta-lactamase class C family) [Pseudoxanthomonas taiwanensis J19]
MALRPSSLCLSCLLALGLVPLAPAVAQEPAAATAPAPAALDPAQLGAWVEAARERFEVPGIAVAVVKDGQVVFEGGWGVRELGQPDPVDAHTLFAIASNTKAFTAASLAMLADEGKLSLEDRVVEHLPEFRMADPYVTAQMRVRDLLTHRSGLGLGAGDLLFWPGSDYSTEEVVARLKDVPLASSFRERYAYDNILYAAATLLIERVSGQSYAQFLQQRFFDPLGMAGTRFNADALRPGDRAASGHAKADFTTLRPTFPLTWHNAAGAGGIYSSVHDMARWMNAQLAGGRYTDAEGREQRLFSERRHKSMWTLHTPINIPEPAVPELAASRPDFLGYGEGWMLSTYRGEKLVWHTGGWPGMVSRVTLVPGRNLGVVVLTNQESGGAFNAVTLHVLDAFLQPAERVDWVAAYAAAAEKSKARADDAWAKRVAARDKRSKPSLPLSGYAATYRDAWYGDVEVKQENGRLLMRFTRSPLLVGELQHWQHDTFLVKWRERTLNGDAFVTFHLDPDGKVREARMEAASDLTDFSFDFQDLVLKPVE